MKRYNGFTILELILVIAILSILLSMSSINLNVRDRIESRYQIREMVSNINFIKNYAQIHNIRTNMIIKEDGYTIIYGENKKDVKFNKLINLKSTNVENLRFTTKGKPSYLNKKNSAGRIEYNIGDRYIYTITVEPVTGKVNLVET